MSGEPSPNGELPHLSFTRIDKYLECPEQYRLYYLEGLRPRVPSGNLLFGHAIHQSLAYLLTTGGDPVAFFRKLWFEAAKSQIVQFSARVSWTTLSTTGEMLLQKFEGEELPKLGNVVASERSFDLAIPNVDVPFIGVIDLVSQKEDKLRITDFKTSSSSYSPHDVALSDQLTAYSLAEPEATEASLCVFVKTKEPRIEWHVSKRSGKSLEEFLKKAEYVAREINARHFYKRPGKWCSWCDFLPICMGNEAKASETLIHVSQERP